jgi:glycopeptide antibiotics resistance protein
LLIVALKKYRYASLSAAVLAFSLDWVTYLNIAHSASSTAAMGFLFTPLWNIVLVIPLSLFVGNFLRKAAEK